MAKDGTVLPYSLGPGFRRGDDAVNWGHRSLGVLGVSFAFSAVLFPYIGSVRSGAGIPSRTASSMRAADSIAIR
jgi:hypothetical protein